MHTRSLAVPVLGLAVLLAACGSGAASPSAAPATVAPASAAAAGAAVALADTSLGRVLVSDKGMTLYAFKPDNAGDSTCYDKCEASWPPLKGTAATAGDGLTAGDFGTTTRKDGSTQITFKKWPLYAFAGDKAAGDVGGQGLGGKWFVVDATGTMVGADAAASPAASQAASPAASQAAAGGPAIDVATNKLGKIIVDGKGMTLYAFAADANGTSACTGDCLSNWPALIGGAAPTLGTGLSAEDFKTITRDDGATQVTFYGMPLYTFAGDKASGDTNGQGLGGKWHVITSDGTVVK